MAKKQRPVITLPDGSKVKECYDCERTLPRTEEFWSKLKRSSDGLSYICKTCMAKRVRTDYAENTEKRRASARRSYYKGDPVVRQARQKTWREGKGKASFKASASKYAKSAKGKATRNRGHKRLSQNPLFVAKRQIRSNVRTALRKKGYKKGSKTEALLGADFDFVIKRLTNHGQLPFEGHHIDHIVPLKFARDKAETEALCHWTNLRLVPKEQNLIKNDRMPTHEELPFVMDGKVLEIYYRETR